MTDSSDDLTYSDKLKDRRWIHIRYLIVKRDNYSCQNCGGHQDWGYKLHVHHKRYIKGYEPWQYDETDLVTLCDRCHEDEHNIEHEDKYIKKTNITNILKKAGFTNG